MPILNLGSNVGDCLNNLRLALRLLQKSHEIAPVQISPLYISSALLPPQAPKSWNRPFLNAAIVCETRLFPNELLCRLKQIEEQLGREKKERWAPRVIDIDILVWDNLLIDQDDLKIPHPGLLHRPFALWPLLDLQPDWEHPSIDITGLIHSWGSRFKGDKSPYRTRQIAQTLEGTALVGILNITPDSFSDGGQYNTVPKAIAQVESLVYSGAEVIDIGAESTRPGANGVTPEEEWALIEPVLTALYQKKWTQWPIKPKLSLDTRHHEVVEKAMGWIDWINDVSGFVDPKMRLLASKGKFKCIVMHNLGIPPNKQKVLSKDIGCVDQLLAWARQRFTQMMDAGVDLDRLIFDVGIGFGKTAGQSSVILKNIDCFRLLGCPLLVGHSRKSFFNLVTDHPPKERDFFTALLSYQLALQKVDYLRVHNVELNAQAIRMA